MEGWPSIPGTSLLRGSRPGRRSRWRAEHGRLRMSATYNHWPPSPRSARRGRSRSIPSRCAAAAPSTATGSWAVADVEVLALGDIGGDHREEV